MNIEEKTKEFERVFYELFPGVNNIDFKYGKEIDGQEVWSLIAKIIPPQNYCLIGSEYFSKCKSLVHFTDLDAVKSIIASRCLRFSSLSKLEDPLEFAFASNLINFDPDFEKDARENMFQISFCDVSDLAQPDYEFNMWRLYGDKGKGVAIEFIVENDQSFWEDFHLSRVQYGNELSNKFKCLFEFLEDLNKEGSVIKIDLGKLIPFHKSKLYKYENEKRIIFDRRVKRAGFTGLTVMEKDIVVFPRIKQDESEVLRSEKQQYFELDLVNDHGGHFADSVPRLKIGSIQLGFLMENASKEIAEIEHLCEKNLGYLPEIKKSNLGKEYWGNSNY